MTSAMEGIPYSQLPPELHTLICQPLSDRDLLHMSWSCQWMRERAHAELTFRARIIKVTSDQELLSVLSMDWVPPNSRPRSVVDRTRDKCASSPFAAQHTGYLIRPKILGPFHSLNNPAVGFLFDPPSSATKTIERLEAVHKLGTQFQNYAFGLTGEESILYLAAHFEDPRVVTWLLSHNVPPKALPFEWSKSPLSRAILKKRWSVVDVMVKHNVPWTYLRARIPLFNVDDVRETPLHCLVRSCQDSERLKQYILPLPRVDTPDTNGWTPGVLARKLSNDAAVAVLKQRTQELKSSSNRAKPPT